MSSIKLESNASGTGIFTLASPATNTNRTLTLPDNTGTILTGSSAITRSQLPAGSVLQVVNSTFGTKVEVSSSTYADTGLSATITPTSSSSKILVIVNVNGIGKYTTNTRAVFNLVRGSTQIIQFEGNAGETADTSMSMVGGSGTSYLDSPATTSATTYKVQIKSAANTTWAAINDSSSNSTITLMEIAA